MVREQVTAIIKSLQVAFPWAYSSHTKEMFRDTISLWTERLKDYDSEIVTQIVLKHVDTEERPPAIGTIISKYKMLSKTEGMGGFEAWHLVRKAISNATYNASLEFEKLPELIKQVVYSAENLRHWAQLDTDVLDSVTQSNFLRCYRGKVKYFEDMEALPEGVRKLITDKNTTEAETERAKQ